jgi:hypothetical protein
MKPSSASWAFSSTPARPCIVRRRRSFDSSLLVAPWSRAFQSLVMMGSPVIATAMGTVVLPNTGSSVSRDSSVLSSTRPSANRRAKGARVHRTGRGPLSSTLVSPLAGTFASSARLRPSAVAVRCTTIFAGRGSAGGAPTAADGRDGYSGIVVAQPETRTRTKRRLMKRGSKPHHAREFEGTPSVRSRASRARSRGWANHVASKAALIAKRWTRVLPSSVMGTIASTRAGT